jgi:hypothetical protein
MNQSSNNGPRPAEDSLIILPDGSRLFRMGDDPDTVVKTWPNCGPSDYAFPPKKDDVRETPHQELMALVNAMCAYKRRRKLEYLLWEDVLDVLHDMGYRKVAPPAAAPEPPAPTESTANP